MTTHAQPLASDGVAIERPLPGVEVWDGMFHAKHVPEACSLRVAETNGKARHPQLRGGSGAPAGGGVRLLVLAPRLRPASHAIPATNAAHTNMPSPTTSP